ncbi:MAG: DNA translocase FtsK 4TM domain-containing protein, partial [Gemmatimonadota bacterium]
MRNRLFAPDDRLQRELWAIALLLLSILLALSFVPPTVMGEPGLRLFPTGNIVGRIGALISRGAWDVFGISAFLIPVLPAVWAAGILERIPPPSTLRLSVLLGGALLIIPTGIHAFTQPIERVPASAGWMGVALGVPLTTALGWVGAGLLVSFAFTALCIFTLRWNPLRSVAYGGGVALSGSRQAAGVLGDAVSRLRISRPRRRVATGARAEQASSAEPAAAVLEAESEMTS